MAQSRCLFDNSSQYYSNRNAKAKALKEIASMIIKKIAFCNNYFTFNRL